MSAVQLWKIDPDTIPTPGPGSVFLFVDLLGVLSHKTSTGEIVPGLPSLPGERGDKGDKGEKGDKGDKGDQGATGSVLVDALAVGAYANFVHGGSANGATIGTPITADGANLFMSALGGTAVAVPVGQVWRYMGGCSGGGPAAYLYQRLS